jgi:hypothetical protein
VPELWQPLALRRLHLGLLTTQLNISSPDKGRRGETICSR